MTDKELIEAATETLAPLDQWGCKCHEASVVLVRSGVLGASRVARGSCEGVGGQHSWVVLGDDCYDARATIVDPTLWSYDADVEGVWVGTADVRHRPFGAGSIWRWGRPQNASGEDFQLKPSKPWSERAKLFLDLLGPLDRNGWITLAHAPVEGWPAAEIIDAMCESELKAHVPIDIVGMLTDRNPQGLYLATGTS